MRFRLLLLVFCLSQLAASSTKRIPVNKLLDQIDSSIDVSPTGRATLLPESYHHRP